MIVENKCQLLQWICVELMGWPWTNDDSYTKANNTLAHRLNNIIYVGVAYHVRFAPEATPYARTWYCFDPANNPRDFQLLLQRLTTLTGIVSFEADDQERWYCLMGSGLDVQGPTTGYLKMNDALMELVSGLHIRLTDEAWSNNPYSLHLKAKLKQLPPVNFNEISYRKA